MGGGGVPGGGYRRCQGMEVGIESQASLAGAGVYREGRLEEWKPPPIAHLLHTTYSL